MYSVNISWMFTRIQATVVGPRDTLVHRPKALICVQDVEDSQWAKYIVMMAINTERKISQGRKIGWWWWGSCRGVKNGHGETLLMWESELGFLSARNSLGRGSSRILKRSAYSIVEEYRRDQGYWCALSEGKRISRCHLVLPDHVGPYRPSKGLWLLLWDRKPLILSREQWIWSALHFERFSETAMLRIGR